MKRFATLLIAALFAAGLSACGAQTTNDVQGEGPDAPSVDSESHFLSFCVGGCPDGLSCLCGVCTRSCSDDDACDELNSDAQCLDPTPAMETSCRFLPVSQVCDVACDNDDDCGDVSAAHVCDRGACRTAPVASEACPAVTLPDCAVGEELAVEQGEDGCPTFTCSAPNACFLPYWDDSPMCKGLDSAMWFNAARGRCERKHNGGCPLDYHFETDEECWNSCLADSQSTCLESWNETWTDAVVTPLASNDLMLDPVTLERQAVLDLVGESRSALLTYPDRTQTELTLTVNNPQSFHVTEVYNPWGSSAGLGPHCWNSVVVEADITLVSADGNFDEAWARVPITLAAWNGQANLSLHLPTDWAEPRVDEVPFQGDYRPALGEDQCAIVTTLRLELTAGAMRGALDQLTVPLPCAEVTENTGVSNSTPATTERGTPLPGGPVWNSRLDSADAQFCDWSTPNNLGPKAFVQSSDYPPSLEGVEPERHASDIATECEAVGGMNCAAEFYLSVFAAECLAREYGLEEGLSGIEARLSVVGTDVQWQVQNVLEDNGADGRSGRQLNLDAITGELVDDLVWAAEP